MASAFNPGGHVLHAVYGPCAVVGVQTDPLAGECLVIAPAVHRSAVIRIPLPRVASHEMQPVTPDEAAAALPKWQPHDSYSEWKNKLRAKGSVRGGAVYASQLRMAASAA